MDYSKVAKAKTYFEAVELLRPLIERFESINYLYHVGVKRFEGEDGVSVWLDLYFSEFNGLVSIVFYSDDSHYMHLKYEGKDISGFFNSRELEEQLDAYSLELNND